MKKNIILLTTLLYVTAYANAQDYNWTEQVITDRSENLQGFAIANDSTATMIGYGNIFVQSTDGGETWQNTGIFEKDDFDYQDISFAGKVGFAVAQTAYKVIDRPAGGSPDLYANSPLLKTSDGGETWELITVAQMGDGTDSTLHPSAPGNYSVKFTAVEVIDSHTVYVAAFWKDVNGAIHQNVLKSADGGANWIPLLPDNGNNYFSAIMNYNNNLYITGNKTLYKISITNNSVSNLYPIIDKDQDAKMYIWYPTVSGTELIFPTTSDSIWVTKDEGASFTAIPNIKKGYYVYKHDANNLVILSSSDDTKATSDGGTTWSSISTGEPLWNGAIIGDSLVALANKKIYKMATTDIASGIFKWKSQTITEMDGKLKGIATSGDTSYIAAFNGFILRSTDKSKTFTPMQLPQKSDIIYASVDLDLRALGQGADGAGIASTRRHKWADYTDGQEDVYMPGFLFSTRDNWASFTVLDDSKIGAKYNNVSANPNQEGCYGQDYYTVECLNDSTFFTFVQWYDTATTDEKTTYARVFKTCDSGQSWDTITSDLGKGFITSICAEDSTLFIGGGNILLKSTDGGTTCTSLLNKLEALNATTPYIQAIVKQKDTLYLPTTNDGVFVSYDNGESFAVIEGVSGANGFVALDKDSWMTLGRESKTLYSNNAGKHWENCSPGASIFSYGGLFNGNIIALAKSKIFKLPIAGLDYDTPASLAPKRVIDTANITLWQTNSMLNIEAQHTINTCKLYRMNGQLAASIAGRENNLQINTSNLKSGIYIVVINTENQISRQKIVLE